MLEDRRLAAIMFTDIVGYTSLMGKDEDQAFEMLKKNHAIHENIINKYNGTLIKEIGDGTLISFPLASDAVRCAMEIQKEAKNQAIPLKIGIHQGEMVMAGKDVLGDGVNIASRLQEISQEGCITISGKVYSDIKNKADIKTMFIEEKILKNVDEPVKVYKVCYEEVEKKDKSEISPAKKTESSIAVLPFVNMSADPEQEYFCDGMTEELINALSHVDSLKVIARTSAFMFKGKQEDIREIGKKLDVDTLLEGSVRKSGNRIRITAQLIKVSDGSHLWSERYDRDLTDVFAIQDEISLSIIEALKVKLLKAEKRILVKRYTENLEAYNLYLLGNYYSQVWTAEGFEKAIECFEQALQKDPTYALAYTGIAYVWFFRAYFGNFPPNQVIPKAKTYLNKALDIDKTLAEAHAILGLIITHYDWNWEVAEQEFKRALELNPNSSFIHLHYCDYLSMVEKHEESVIEVKRARELDPLNINISTNVGERLYFARQFDNAIEDLQKTIEMDKNWYFSHLMLGLVYLAKKMFKESIVELEKGVELSGEMPFAIVNLAIVYYRTDRKADFEKLFKKLEEMAKEEYIPASFFFIFYKIQGNMELAFNWLEKACEDRDIYLPYYLIFVEDYLLIPYDKKSADLLKKVGLVKKGT